MSDWQWGLGMIVLTALAVGFAVWPWRKQRYALWCMVPLILVCAGLMYGLWGAWPAWRSHQQHMRQRARVQDVLNTLKGPDSLIKRLQTHLNAQPNSARGWYLLGRLYASQQRWEDALQALERAHKLKPQDELMAVNYAQSLFSNQSDADQMAARHVLAAVLKQNPNQADALAMMAMDAQHRHADKEALAYWERLLTLVPPYSKEADAVRKAILIIQSKKQ